MEKYNEKNTKSTTKEYCHYCCHGFKTKPLQMPVLIKKNEIYVKFNFCSWECMKTYNNENNHINKMKVFSLITLLHNKMTNTCDEIDFAPSKLNLIIFGGTMSITDFRKKNKKYKYILLENPIVNVNPSIDKIENFSWIKTDNANETFQNFNKDKIENIDSMKLKRQQPVSNEQNTLEKSMGIFKTS